MGLTRIRDESPHDQQQDLGHQRALAHEHGHAADMPRAARPRLGGISFLHRFGSALNHRVHLHGYVTDGVFVPAAAASTGDAHGSEGFCNAKQQPRSHDTSRIAWAKLMARVGEEFPLACPACGGDIRLRGDGRQEPAHFEPEVRKRAKARMASPA